MAVMMGERQSGGLLQRGSWVICGSWYHASPSRVGEGPREGFVRAERQHSDQLTVSPFLFSCGCWEMFPLEGEELEGCLGSP